LGVGLGWTLAAQDAKPQKNWKDRAEYDMADAANKAAAKDRLALLDKWKAGYAQTEFADEREDLYLITYSELGDCRRAFDKSVEIQKARPKHERSIAVVIGCVQTFNPPSAADYDNALRIAKFALDNINDIYADSNKPAGGQFAASKADTQLKALMLPGWAAFNRKDFPKAETELTAILKADPTQAQASNMLANSLVSQQKEKPEKVPLAMFEFARAASYDGPNSLPAAGRKQLNDYLTRIYTSYHGSAQGLDQLLAVAKTNALPPADWAGIKDKNTLDREAQEEQEKLDAQNPMKTLWVKVLKTPLTAADGDTYFAMNVEGTGLPGGVNGVNKFKGKIISMTPANRPKEVQIAVEKPDVADAVLKFDDPLPGKMEPGEDLEFSGTAKSFVKSPFMITFEVEPADLVGWTGKNAGGAAKGKAAPGAGATKGKAATPAPATKGKQVK
jgi:hypothetical protein